MDWKHWTAANWIALKAGNKIFVSQTEICHPRQRPDLFSAGIGFPDGQTCDYMMRLQDGSRIHVQCYRDDTQRPMFRVHRDRWDPDRDPVSFILHALFETPAGPALAGVAVLAVLRS